MEGGDLSNIAPPRFLFVFEGLVGRLDSVTAPKENLYRRLRRWKKAAACWEINEVAVAYLWDIVWRHHMQADLATYLPYHEQIHERMDEEGLPFGNFYHFENPDHLGQRLAYMPYVYRVFFSEPHRPFIFGDRGEYVDAETVFDPLR